MRLTDAPLARPWPWPRWVLVMKSSRRRASHTPTATPSSPTYRWARPGILAPLYSSFTCSSKARIFAICRYMCRFCSSSIRGSIVWVVIQSSGASGLAELPVERGQADLQHPGRLPPVEMGFGQYVLHVLRLELPDCLAQ